MGSDKARDLQWPAWFKVRFPAYGIPERVRDALLGPRLTTNALGQRGEQSPVEHRLAAVLAADVVDFAQRIAVDEVSELERLRELRGDDLVGGFVIDECVKEQQAALCGRRPRRR
jgi:hypothetical protein